MGADMKGAKLRQVTEVARSSIVRRAPKRTGNLAYNSVQTVYAGADRAVINIDQAIAPYMPYTNEPWVAARWNGRQNPNEGWFDEAAKDAATQIARAIGGKIKR